MDPGLALFSLPPTVSLSPDPAVSEVELELPRHFLQKELWLGRRAASASEPGVSMGERAGALWLCCCLWGGKLRGQLLRSTKRVT